MTDRIELEKLSAEATGRSRSELLDHAPINSLAPALSGGCWMKTERGWHWNGHVSHSGGVFHGVGADWDGSIVLPLPDGSPHVAWKPTDRVVLKFDALRSGHLVPAESGWREADIETAAMAMFRANGGKSKLAYLNDDQNDARDDELLKVYRKLARAAADVFTPPNATPDTRDEVGRLRERIVELEAENADLQRKLIPDMYWDADDPEQSYESPENLLHEREYEGEGVLELQRAISLPTEAWHFVMSDEADEETGDRIVSLTKLSDQQYSEMRACRKVGWALRLMGKARLESKARELFANYSADELGIRSRVIFEHLPLRVRSRLEREARTALESGHG